MLARAVRIATIRGTEVRLDPSLAVLAVLLAWLLTTRFGPVHGTPVALAMAAVGSLAFFASILAHELAHALEATHRGIRVASITLLLFGGVTEMHTGARRPRDEFAVAAVGPYVSLVCAAVAHLTAVIVRILAPDAVAAPVAELATLLAYLNLLLALFNLVPGAPLDGGRVLRAGLWWLTGDRRRAVRGAARAGQGFAAALVAFGVYEFVAGLEVAAIGGIWWVLIGAFLFVTARAELRRSDVQLALESRTAADALGGTPLRVDADATLAGLELPRDGPDHVLVQRDGEVVGWIPAGDLVGGTLDERTAISVAAPLTTDPTVRTTTPLPEVLARFGDGARRLRVVDGSGATVAVLTERRTAEALRSWDVLRRPRATRPARARHEVPS